MKALDLVVGGRYNWKGQPERLIFLGRELYPDGFWYQFAKVEDPNVIWSEVRLHDLESFEETLDPVRLPKVDDDRLLDAFATRRGAPVDPAKAKVLSERAAWNAEVDRKRAEKLARKGSRDKN